LPDGYCLWRRTDFVGGINPFTGEVMEKGHQLEGKRITDKVLVYPTGKGSTGGSYRIYDMAKRGTGPKAIINLRAEPITAIGAIIGEIPMVDKLSQDPTQLIQSGDWVRVEATQGRVKVTIYLNAVLGKQISVNTRSVLNSAI
jgi:predicted aconitase with swiveling domain